MLGSQTPCHYLSAPRTSLRTASVSARQGDRTDLGCLAVFDGVWVKNLLFFCCFGNTRKKGIQKGRKKLHLFQG